MCTGGCGISLDQDNVSNHVLFLGKRIVIYISTGGQSGKRDQNDESALKVGPK